jgi:hypothetical protein
MPGTFPTEKVDRLPNPDQPSEPGSDRLCIAGGEEAFRLNL